MQLSVSHLTCSHNLLTTSLANSKLILRDEQRKIVNSITENIMYKYIFKRQNPHICSLCCSVEECHQALIEDEKRETLCCSVKNVTLTL